MKTIGIIGGLGSPSTVKYYEWLTEGVQQRTAGESHGARVLINALDGKDVAAFRRAGDDEGEGQFFAEEARRLERAGAECILIASNTSHRNAPSVEKSISIPLIHLARATGESVARAGQRRVILLGTATTMKSRFYTSILEECGLEVAVPPDADCEYMSEAIYSRLILNVIDENDRARFAEITHKLVGQHHSEAVILGCTELTLLGLPDLVDLPFHDTIRIHVNAALDFCFS